MRRRRFTATAIAALFGTCMVVPALAADIDYGKPGTPVKLVVGYQPYYTQSWSGVVMRGKKFYEKYLPKGSEVEFQIGLQGAIIVNNMLAGKQNIGYMGDMPSIVSTTKTEVADVRLVANLGLAWDQCNAFLVRNDAPQFKSDKEAIAWLNGKTVAVPKGSCTDRFAQATFKRFKIEPKEYLNQNIEVITSNFRAGKLDAAVLWHSLYGRYADEAGGGDVRNIMHYTFTPETLELINRAATFLHSIKSISTDKVRPEAIEAKWTQDILKERGLKAPIGEVKALPASQAPKF